MTQEKNTSSTGTTKAHSGSGERPRGSTTPTLSTVTVFTREIAIASSWKSSRSIAAAWSAVAATAQRSASKRRPSAAVTTNPAPDARDPRHLDAPLDRDARQRGDRVADAAAARAAGRSSAGTPCGAAAS